MTKPQSKYSPAIDNAATALNGITHGGRSSAMLRVIPKIYRPHMVQAAEHVSEAVHTQRTCVAFPFRSYLWRSSARGGGEVAQTPYSSV
jgi:hypothetical protein